MFRRLLWKGKNPRIRLSILQRERDGGGLAIPHPRLYFKAAQLQHFAGWGAANWEDSIQALLLSNSSHYNLLAQLESGAFAYTCKSPTMILMNRVWKEMRSIMKYAGASEYSPLWWNRQYKELGKLKGFESWCFKGLQYITQLYSHNILRSFQDLQESFHLPHHNFFKYLQLRHVVQSQFKGEKKVIKPMPLITLLARMTEKKGLISSLYGQLTRSYRDEGASPGRRGWELDIGDISDETWQKILERVPLASLSPAQCLTQLFIIYRVYRTPVKLFKWGRRDSPYCPRCQKSPADLLHMLWNCPKLAKYWREVVNTINDTFKTYIHKDPKTCLLGYLDEELMPHEILIPVSRLLFLARKLIALRWIYPSAPSFEEWRLHVNDNILKEQQIYCNRGIPNYLYKLWKPWISVPRLAPSSPVFADL